MGWKYPVNIWSPWLPHPKPTKKLTEILINCWILLLLLLQRRLLLLLLLLLLLPLLLLLLLLQFSHYFAAVSSINASSQCDDPLARYQSQGQGWTTQLSSNVFILPLSLSPSLPLSLSLSLSHHHLHYHDYIKRQPDIQLLKTKHHPKQLK